MLSHKAGGIIKWFCALVCLGGLVISSQTWFTEVCFKSSKVLKRKDLLTLTLTYSGSMNIFVV